MFFKKSVVLWSMCFMALNYAAEQTDDLFSIECVDSVLWQQVAEDGGSEKRVLVVLHWPNSRESSYIPHFVTRKTENEMVLNVDFWEQVPQRYEQPSGQQVFFTDDLKTFFYSKIALFLISPRRTLFSSREGVAVVDDEYSNYASFPDLINEVLISFLKQKFIYKKIVFCGNKELLKYVNESSIHRALDGVYREESYPIQKFTTALVGTPPRPAALRPSLPAISQGVENWGFDSDRASLSGLRSRLLLLQKVPSEGVPVVTRSLIS